MMAYSTITDVLNVISINELARVTGDSTGSSVDTDRVDYAIEAADSLINSYLIINYDLPLAATHNIIKDLSVSLAIVFIYEYYYRDSELPKAITDKKRFVTYELYKFSRGWVRLTGEKFRNINSAIKNTYNENAITKDDLNKFEL